MLILFQAKAQNFRNTTAITLPLNSVSFLKPVRIKHINRRSLIKVLEVNGTAVTEMEMNRGNSHKTF